MSAPNDVVEFSRITTAYYDAALGSLPWSVPLGQTAELLGAAASTFSVHDPVTRQSDFIFGQFGTDDAFSRSYVDTYAVMSPFSVGTMLVEAGQAVKPFDVVGRDEVLQGRFFTEWCKPQRYNDFIGAVLLRSPRANIAFAFVRLDDQPLFGEAERAQLQMLLPHITRAVSISRMLTTLSSSQTDLMHVVDGMPTAMFVVDGARTISQANKAAVRLAADDGPLLTSGGRLQFRDAATQAAFAATIARPVIAACTHAIKGWPPLVFDVVPMGTTQKPQAAVFIHPAQRSAKADGILLQDKFDFTVSELRVLLLLMSGGTRQSIAEDLGISVNTVATHFAALFRKASARSQADLIRIVMTTLSA